MEVNGELSFSGCYDLRKAPTPLRVKVGLGPRRSLILYVVKRNGYNCVCARHERMQGAEIKLCSFLTSALNRRVLSALRYGHCIQRKMAPVPTDNRCFWSQSRPECLGEEEKYLLPLLLQDVICD
jgi:hypothetical protein